MELNTSSITSLPSKETSETPEMLIKKPRGRPRKEQKEEKEKKPRGRPMKPKSNELSVEKKPKGRPTKYEKGSPEYYEAQKASKKKYYLAHPNKLKEEITIRPLSVKNPDLLLNKRIKNHVHHLKYLKKHDKNDQKFSKYDDVEPTLYTYTDSENPRVTIQTYVQRTDPL
jgi:hypothetical protein